jgi:anti-sigma B factor antagonist
MQRPSGTAASAVVTAGSTLDIRTVHALRQELLEAISGCGRVAVDLEAVEYADQAALGLLVGAHRRARARGGHLVVVCTREPVLRLIRATGLMRLLDVSDRVPQAG